MPRTLQNMTPEERDQYRQMAGEATATIIPQGSRFILLVFDEETGRTEIVSDAIPAIVNLIMENVLRQRQRRN